MSAMALRREAVPRTLMTMVSADQPIRTLVSRERSQKSCTCSSPSIPIPCSGVYRPCARAPLVRLQILKFLVHLCQPVMVPSAPASSVTVLEHSTSVGSN